MYNSLKDLSKNHRECDFLFPALPNIIKGKVTHIKATRVVIESDIDGEIYQYITHPSSIYIVQKKA